MRLVALFPRGWRQRYGEEFEVLLEESDLSLVDLLDLARGAWDARLHPQPHLETGGEAGGSRRRVRAWEVRSRFPDRRQLTFRQVFVRLPAGMLRGIVFKRTYDRLTRRSVISLNMLSRKQGL